jgi:predicted enzyme related to lactoylglutathione lyase
MAPKNKLGIFPWYSLQSTNPEKSVEFYKKLLGLTITEFEIPGMGKSFILNKTMQFADVTKTKVNAWSTYMTVENVDDFIKRATKMGGTVVAPAYNMKTIGRAAVMKDPCGATFLPFTPESWEKTSSAMGMEEGMICWNELAVKDTKKAMGFYGECLGWKFTKAEGPDVEYHMFTPAGAKESMGGIMKTPPGMDMPPSWTPYLLTKDVKASTKKAKELGATICMQPKEIPNTGIFSMIQDPVGCLTYLFTGYQR